MLRPGCTDRRCRFSKNTTGTPQKRIASRLSHGRNAPRRPLPPLLPGKELQWFDWVAAAVLVPGGATAQRSGPSEPPDLTSNGHVIPYISYISRHPMGFYLSGVFDRQIRVPVCSDLYNRSLEMRKPRPCKTPDPTAVATVIDARGALPVCCDSHLSAGKTLYKQFFHQNYIWKFNLLLQDLGFSSHDWSPRAPSRFFSSF